MILVVSKDKAHNESGNGNTRVYQGNINTSHSVKGVIINIFTMYFVIELVQRLSSPGIDLAMHHGITIGQEE